jgi:hypothetical protein
LFFTVSLFFMQTVCWSLVFPRASTARSCFLDQCIRFVFHSRLGARVGNPLPLPVSLDCVPRQDPFLPLIASGHVRLGTSVSPVLPQRFLLPIRFFFLRDARSVFGHPQLELICVPSFFCFSHGCPGLVASFFCSAQSPQLFHYFDFASSSYVWNGCR